MYYCIEFAKANLISSEGFNVWLQFVYTEKIVYMYVCVWVEHFIRNTPMKFGRYPLRGYKEN